MTDDLKNLPLSYAGTGNRNIMIVKTAPGREMSQAEIQALKKKQHDYLNNEDARSREAPGKDLQVASSPTD